MKSRTTKSIAAVAAGSRLGWGLSGSGTVDRRRRR